LVELSIPDAKFDRDSLNCFKYFDPKDVSKISGDNKGFTMMNALVVASNTTYTNLMRSDFSKNMIGNLGGVKIGSNNFGFTWRN
jgi:hypothetical protein